MLLLAGGTAAADDLVFQDGFEGGNLLAWSASATDGGDLSVTAEAALNGTTRGLEAVVNDLNPLFVRDDTPADESRYRARFWLDPNGFDPGEASNHLRVRLLIASGVTNQRLIAIVLRRRNGAYSIEARVRLDSGQRADTGFFTITDAPHSVEFDWIRATSPGAADGTFELWVDGAPASTLTGLADGTDGVESARLGVMSPKTGAGGTVYLDEFESHHPPVCPDADHDGWTTCDGDCCDSPGACAADPFSVNPGAFEVMGNSVDDDCNGLVDEAPPACDAGLASNSSDPLDYARAMDLCASTTEAPPLAQRGWGVIGGSFALASGTGTPAVAARSIRTSFGAGVTPQAGAALAVLSTGAAAAPGQTNPGFVSPQPGLINTTSSPPPADWLAANGGVLPAAPGCPGPAGTTTLDPILLKLRIRVPTNARSFSLRAALLSSEFPEWVCTSYDDYFLALLDSSFVPGAGESANPADRNIAVFQPSPPDGPVYLVGSGLAYGNVPLFQECKNGPVACFGGSPGTISTCTETAQLAGTGFDLVASAGSSCTDTDLVGGGTGWFTLSGNVTPGETIELRFVVWDSGDGSYDSDVLLDGFQWSTVSTTPGVTP